MGHLKCGNQKSRERYSGRGQRLMAKFSQDCKFSLWDPKEVAELLKTVENQLLKN